MPDLMDLEQETQMRELEQIQERARHILASDAQPRPAIKRPICACGVAIDKRRLQALPTAKTCIDCARADELRASRYRRG